jgi:hypothetical protein
MRGELRQTIVVGTVTMHHNTNRHLFSSQEQTLLFNPNPRQIGSHRGKLQWYFCLNHTLTEDIKTASTSIEASEHISLENIVTNTVCDVPVNKLVNAEAKSKLELRFKKDEIEVQVRAFLAQRQRRN